MNSGVYLIFQEKNFIPFEKSYQTMNLNLFQKTTDSKFLLLLKKLVLFVHWRICSQKRIQMNWKNSNSLTTCNWQLYLWFFSQSCRKSKTVLKASDILNFRIFFFFIKKYNWLIVKCTSLCFQSCLTSFYIIFGAVFYTLFPLRSCIFQKIEQNCELCIMREDCSSNQLLFNHMHIHRMMIVYSPQTLFTNYIKNREMNNYMILVMF